MQLSALAAQFAARRLAYRKVASRGGGGGGGQVVIADCRLSNTCLRARARAQVCLVFVGAADDSSSRRRSAGAAPLWRRKFDSTRDDESSRNHNNSGSDNHKPPVAGLFSCPVVKLCAARLLTSVWTRKKIRSHRRRPDDEAPFELEPRATRARERKRHTEASQVASFLAAEFVCLLSAERRPSGQTNKQSCNYSSAARSRRRLLRPRLRQRQKRQTPAPIHVRK